MSATNATTNYSLPLFQATDKPAWLTDWNGAMGDIDTAIKAAQTAADNAGTAAASAASDITTINSSINTINSSLTSLTTNVNTNTGAINTINSLIGNGTPTTTDQTIIGAINELHADITGGGTDIDAVNVDYDNTTSGLTATNVQTAIDEVVSSIPSPGTQFDFDLSHRETVTVTGETGVTVSNSDINCIHNADFNIGKIYGSLEIQASSTISAGSDVATITVPNLNTTASYNINGLAFAMIDTGNEYYLSAGEITFNVGNTISIKASSTLQNGYRLVVILPPCVLFFEDLGD